MRAFFRRMLPGKESWLSLIEFILLVVFYAVIPFWLFCETYGGATYIGSKISLGFAIGVILIVVVFKRMWLNDFAKTLSVRVGIMTDNYKTETEPLKKRRIAFQLAIKKLYLTLLNLIVPVISIGTVVLVASTIGNTVEVLAKLKQCVWYSSISFGMGVITQIIFPFIKASSCNKIERY